MQDERELAYWMMSTAVMAMAREILDREVMRPHQIHGLVTQAVEIAVKAHREAQDRARAGH